MHAPSNGLPPSTNDSVQERRGLLSFEELAFKMSYPVKVHFLALFVTDVRRVASRQSLSLSFFLSLYDVCSVQQDANKRAREREKQTTIILFLFVRSFVAYLFAVCFYISLSFYRSFFFILLCLCARVSIFLYRSCRCLHIYSTYSCLSTGAAIRSPITAYFPCAAAAAASPTEHASVHC